MTVGQVIGILQVPRLGGVREVPKQMSNRTEIQLYLLVSPTRLQYTEDCTDLDMKRDIGLLLFLFIILVLVLLCLSSRGGL